MAIDTIFWDIGGVLERTEDPVPRRQVADRLGRDAGDLARLIFGHADGFRVQLGQISMADHLANIADALQLDIQETGQVIEQFFAGDSLDQELVTAIRGLQEDYTTAVISNYTPILREKLDDLWEISDIFDHLIISSEVGVMKPDPEIFRIALGRTGTLPHAAVFIDDYTQNVDSACQVGMHAIHFQTTRQTLAELEQLLETHQSE